MTTFTTKILNVKVLPQDPKLGLQNVVFLIGFMVEGVDGEFKHSVARNIGIGPADLANFTPIDQLTTEQLLAFMTTALAPDDMRCIENEINNAIESQKNPRQQPVVIDWTNK
jgi:hypothetical protein